MSTENTTPFTTTRDAKPQTTEDEIRHATQDLIDANPEQYEENVFARIGDFEVNSAGIMAQIDVTYEKKTDIFLAGVVTLPSDNGRFVNERVMTKTPYEAKDTINETWDLSCYPDYDGGRWHFEAEKAKTFITHLIEAGFSIAGPIQLLADFLDVTPIQQPTNSTATGGAKTPDVTATECPVDGCDFHCTDFKQLRGHIGGKVRGQDTAHKEVDLNIDDYR